MKSSFWVVAPKSQQNMVGGLNSLHSAAHHQGNSQARSWHTGRHPQGSHSHISEIQVIFNLVTVSKSSAHHPTSWTKSPEMTVD